mgnify:CR=1 FL=1|tara:strand:- start:290 stop:529 length:240 start_codon:yes stop_codon:yes gene_type:complete
MDIRHNVNSSEKETTNFHEKEKDYLKDYSEIKTILGASKKTRLYRLSPKHHGKDMDWNESDMHANFLNTILKPCGDKDV